MIWRKILIKSKKIENTQLSGEIRLTQIGNRVYNISVLQSFVGNGQAIYRTATLAKQTEFYKH